MDNKAAAMGPAMKGKSTKTNGAGRIGDTATALTHSGLQNWKTNDNSFQLFCIFPINRTRTDGQLIMNHLRCEESLRRNCGYRVAQIFNSQYYAN